MNLPASKPRSHWPISILSTASSLLNMLLPLVLVRILDPAEIGNFKIFFLYLIIISRFSLFGGLINGLAYWAGQPKRHAALRQSGLLVLGLGLASLVVMLAASPFISKWLGWSTWWAVLFAFSITGAIAADFYVEAAVVTGRIWRGAIFHSSFELLRTGAIVTTALLFRTLDAVFLAHAAMSLLKTVIGHGLAYRNGLNEFKLSKTITTKVFRYAFPVSLAELLQMFVVYADQIVLSSLIAPQAFAIYAIGCLSIPPLLVLEHSVTRVLIPQMSEEFAKDNPAGAAALYSYCVEQLAMLIIPTVTGLVVFAEPIIEILFTERYSAASRFLTVYALTYLYLIFPYDAVARARGEASWILKNCALFSVVSLAIAYVFASTMGPMGALVGVLISRGAMRLVGFAYILRSTPWRLSQFIPYAVIGRITTICLALAGGCLIGQRYFSDQRLWFLVCGTVFSLVYSALVFVPRMQHRSTAGAEA